METFELWVQKYVNQYFSSIAKVLIWMLVVMLTGLMLSNYCIKLDPFNYIFTAAGLHILYLPIAASNFKILKSDKYASVFFMLIGEILCLGFFIYGLKYESEFSEIFHNASWVALDLTVVPMMMESRYARAMKLQPLMLWIFIKLYRNQFTLPTSFEPYFAMAFSVFGVLYLQSKYLNSVKSIFRSHIKVRAAEAQLKNIIQ